MALTSFTAGTKAKSSEVNNNFGSFTVFATYSGTAFNSSDSSGSGTTTASHEITISAATLKNATYIKTNIMVSGSATASGGSGADTGYSSIKLEEKYVGGGYSTLYDTTVVYAIISATNSHAGTLSYVHTLTANDIANGVTFKITGSSTSGGGAGNNSSVNNVQCSFIGIG